MNKYEVKITCSGYIRTNNNLSGHAWFEQDFKIKANSEEEARDIANSEYLGNCFETFQNAGFNFDWKNDSICRDDTFKEIDIELVELSMESCIKIFEEDYFSKFPIKINEEDKKEIIQNLYEQILIYDITSDIWDFIDDKYFLGNVRLSIPELNLKNIMPETYFKKDTNFNILVNGESYNHKELIELLNNTISLKKIEDNDLNF